MKIPNKVSFRSLGLLLMLSFSLSNFAETPERPRSMASLGDSITAAAIAGIPRQWGFFPWAAAELSLRMIPALITKSTKSVEYSGMSWATGFDSRHQVLSHASKLWYLNGGSLKIHNSAISGRMAQDLVDEELPELNEWSRLNVGTEYPDYITFLIGPNDICTNEISNAKVTDPALYRERIEGALQEILFRSPNTKILISSVPKIHTLQKTARNKWVTLIPGLNKCEDIWKATKFCLNAQLGGDALLAEIENYVNEYNGILKDLANKYRRDYGDQVRFSEGVSQYDFNANELALDCFHPNFYAQNTLSDKTFAESWWQEEWAANEKQAKKYFEREAKRARDRIRRSLPRN